MVAASARAWLMFTCGDVMSFNSVSKMFMAPMTSLRRRSGRAWTIWNPAAWAIGPNRGHRSVVEPRALLMTCLATPLTVETGPLLVLHLEQLGHPHPFGG